MNDYLMTKDELRAALSAAEAKLAKYTRPLTEEQKTALHGSMGFWGSMFSEDIDGVDAAIRKVRGE